MALFKKKPGPELDGATAPPSGDPTPGQGAEEKPAPPQAAPADQHPNPQPEHVPSPRRAAE